MMNRTRARADRAWGRRGVTAALAAACVAAGCSKPPPPPPPAPVQHTPAPRPVEVDGLLQAMQADSRVQFPQEQAPENEELARAVIRLADALAKGDSETFRSLLDRPSQAVLDDLLGTGEWYEATAKIEAVRVVKLDEGTGALQVAVQEPGRAYLLAWTAMPAFESFVFAASPAPGGTRARASDWDGGAEYTAPALGATQSGNEDRVGDQAPPEAPEAPAAPEEESESGPRRKNTPAGPVTIPGGS